MRLQIRWISSIGFKIFVFFANALLCLFFQRGALCQGVDPSLLTKPGFFIPLNLNTWPATNYLELGAYMPAANETSANVRSVVMLNLKEESINKFVSPFSASVSLKIEYRETNTSSIQTLNNQVLEINYHPGEGYKHDAKQYFVLERATWVKVTVLSITPANLGSFEKGWLEVKLEREVWRTAALGSNAPAPVTTGDGLMVNGNCEVSWETDNVNIGHSGVQLEWTFVEDDYLGQYLNFPDNYNSINFNKLFGAGTTRIDLGSSKSSFRIPLLYAGRGKLYWRVRFTGLLGSGTQNHGQWSPPRSKEFFGHLTEDLNTALSLNWQATTSFAEDGKLKSVVQYFDGVLRQRQTVTRDNASNKLVIAETFYDGAGRPAIQVLPTPQLSGAIAYIKNLNQFNGQPIQSNPAEFFDLYPINMSGNLIESPGLKNDAGASRYYSNNNPDKNASTQMSAIPDAQGYPYTQTLYTPDGTGRVMVQSGVGAMHKMGSGHETRYYYGKPSQTELDALFGTEVGYASHYSKNMVIDANGQASISYADMHGRTIATALAGASPQGIEALKYTVNTLYPGQHHTNAIQLDMLGTEENMRKDNRIETTSTLLVAQPAAYTFDYVLNARALTLMVPEGSNSVTRCYDCLYDLTFTITKEDGTSLPIIKKFSNIPVGSSEDELCTTGTPLLKALDVNGNQTGIASNTVNFQQLLEIGAYTIQKSLSISEKSMHKYKELYENAFVAEKFNSLFIAAKAEMEAMICPPGAVPITCSTCTSSLGYLSDFKVSYLEKLGLPPAGPHDPLLIKMIEEVYYNRKATCNAICENIASRPAIYRTLMLNDFTPEVGQYATTAYDNQLQNQLLWNKFSIFGPNSNGNSPAFRSPLDPISTTFPIPAAYFKNSNNQNDKIHQDQNGNIVYPVPAIITTSDFANKWQNQWAENLLPYHPEYKKLLEAEKPEMVSAYNWGHEFIQTQTWAVALSKGYINSLATVDVFYNTISGSTVSQVLALNNEKTSALNGQFYGYAGQTATEKLNMWQMAYASAMCMSSVQTGCYLKANLPATPTHSVFNTLTDEQRNRIWVAFRGLYTSLREDHILKYLALKAPYNSDVLALANPSFGFRLHFPVSVTQQSQQANLPITSGSFPANLDAECNTRCSAYINIWRSQLLACDALKNHPNQITITNNIINRMLVVCNNGCDVSHPNGSSTVNLNRFPGAVDKSFEQIIQQEFSAASPLIPANTALCNPFVITLPAPYGKNSDQAYNELSVIQANGTGYCQRFNQILAQCGSCNTLANLNIYLTSNYGETISQGLYDELIKCAGVNSNTVIIAAAPHPVPRFLQVDASYVRGSECLSCNDFIGYIGSFKSAFPNSSIMAGVPYSGSELTQDQLMANATFEKYLNNKTGFSYSLYEYIQYANGVSCNWRNIIPVQSFSQPFTSMQATPLSAASPILVCRKGNIDYGSSMFYKPGPCQEATEIAYFRAKYEADWYRNKRFDEFVKQYQDRCLENIGLETFTISFVPREYHYTLYYYDQAGNLVKTIPPSGVRPNFESIYLNEVITRRKNGLVATRVPDHILATQYRYNSLNQVTYQQTPDAGLSQFWYDRLGRLVVSQNAKQKAVTGSKKDFSYTLYDVLGRIIEIGQKPQSTLMVPATARNEQSLANWLSDNTQGALKGQITRTIYDQPYDIVSLADPDEPNGDYIQRNLRNRVSATMVIKTENSNVVPYETASFYSYDAQGNVYDLLMDYHSLAHLSASDNRFKRIQYYFDLVSGKVNEVHYQNNSVDAFFHRYSYDAENRLTDVQTSRDFMYWERDAVYEYYPHGPLARTKLGASNVQGIDYAYTLQGWLKGVNSTVLEPGMDIGEDGLQQLGHPRKNFGQDAFGFALHYYQQDYININSSVIPRFADLNSAIWTGSPGGQLYNGNIAAMVVNIPKVGMPLAYRYGYDQLNRLLSMDAWQNPNTGTPELTDSYKERVTYDPNGNILSYFRNGAKSDRGVEMDKLTYQYAKNASGYLTNNKLRYVHDQVAATAYPTEDIDNQTSLLLQQVIDEKSAALATDNYQYDEIGNLITDVKEGISDIKWTVYGKIELIAKSDGSTLNYIYDASGNRIEKKYSKGGVDHYTWYVRDAQGNVMAVYEKRGTSGAVRNTETHLYGSSRLGILKELTKTPVDLDGDINVKLLEKHTFTRGEKFFELTNHLGNVLAVVADKKLPVKAIASNDINFWQADVVTATDYYPFGMPMPGRNGLAYQSTWIPGQGFVPGNAYSEYLSVGTRYAPMPNAYRATREVQLMPGFESYNEELIVETATNYVTANTLYPGGEGSYESYGYYRYGFNGQEKSDEIKGSGNSYTAEFWEYDPRIGRRWNVDPVYKHSPYEAFAGNPIIFSDPMGLDTISFNKHTTIVTPTNSGFSGGKMRSTVKSTFSINVKEAPGDDVFMSVNTTTQINGDGSVSHGSRTKILDPYSNNASGVTKGQNLYFDGLWTSERDNKDWESVGKFMNLDRGFYDYMVNRHPASAGWRSKALSIEAMEGVLPVLVSSGLGSYAGFRYLAAAKLSSRAFWAGAGTEASALEKGFLTLSQTRAGQNLIKLTEGMPFYPGSQSYNWWAKLSKAYVKGIPKGSTVHVFLKNPSATSIYNMVEKPILESNGIKIIEHVLK
jgi:hypothetical protein